MGFSTLLFLPPNAPEKVFMRVQEPTGGYIMLHPASLFPRISIGATTGQWTGIPEVDMEDQMQIPT